ncbi:hypothetical protein PS619_05314 [Pseudomonas fluorescens]|jgi:hypothetical protein|uniref:Uncharacterized protein n=1 Tax=Pseudomonas tensinigenes TaxID=2745511 RepID=A0ABX8PUI6_9PSED|nr:MULTISPECIES: hypothetical protein [Pseudomonas]MBY8937529.1 hypothetical protein [Pseudomonas fluorescens]QXI05078.1 hypothetical protein HU718_024095 [Pseudomonas tensinigenes]VVN39766.1 hypothetical protein PS619_05314 [Pseudomonas fluorescens]VVN45610.1 hypothetical protein PS681_05755 [Pseudomonas fluorescens]VVN74895.1 hypothetical protein PS684_06027 [Pseudomonas fluorescens]
MLLKPGFGLGKGADLRSLRNLGSTQERELIFMLFKPGFGWGKVLILM